MTRMIRQLIFCNFTIP
uniref:Uncharacterized protein n=1 Tax=Rhizophora mucronata TaxID=61149 RepID=A0A2P2NTI9_RHIMU